MIVLEVATEAIRFATALLDSRISVLMKMRRGIKSYQRRRCRFGPIKRGAAAIA
jgi:hypothetical protein